MELLIKSAAVCVSAAVIATVIKKDNPAVALLLTIAAGCVAIYAFLSPVGEIVGFLNEIADTAGINPPVLTAIVRGLGIAIIARFAGDICKDSGMSAASSAVELAGSTAILYVALPVIRTVFQMIKGLIS